MWTSFAWAAVAIGATLIDQPSIGLFLLPLVPLAGLAGYLRRSASDQLLAQVLDQQLKSQELLASGLVCRGNSDDASRMIAAQAESAAGAVDRATLRQDVFTRAEAAAGLVLVIAAIVGIGYPRSQGHVSDASPEVARRLDASQTAAAQSRFDRPELPSRSSESQTRATRDSEESDGANDGTGQSREKQGPRSRDASGDGAASTTSNRSTVLPSARASDSTGMTSSEAQSGIGKSSIASNRPATSIDSALAPRKPLSIESASLPDPAACERARAALEAEQIGMESRDLVRAYFDLDESR